MPLNDIMPLQDVVGVGMGFDLWTWLLCQSNYLDNLQHTLSDIQKPYKGCSYLQERPVLLLKPVDASLHTDIG